MPPVRVSKESGANRSSPSLDGVSPSPSSLPSARKAGKSYRDVLVLPRSESSSAGSDGSVLPEAAANATQREEGVTPDPLVVSDTIQNSNVDVAGESVPESAPAGRDSYMSDMSTYVPNGDIPTGRSSATVMSSKELSSARGVHSVKPGRHSSTGTGVRVKALGSAVRPDDVVSSMRDGRKDKSIRRRKGETSFSPVSENSAAELNPNTLSAHSSAALGSVQVDGVRYSHRIASPRSGSATSDQGSGMSGTSQQPVESSQLSSRDVSPDPDGRLESQLRRRVLSSTPDMQPQCASEGSSSDHDVDTGPSGSTLKSALKQPGRRRKVPRKQHAGSSLGHGVRGSDAEDRLEHQSSVSFASDSVDSDGSAHRRRRRPRRTSPNGRTKSAHRPPTDSTAQRSNASDGHGTSWHRESIPGADQRSSTFNGHGTTEHREPASGTAQRSLSSDGHGTTRHRNSTSGTAQRSLSSDGHGTTRHRDSTSGTVQRSLSADRHGTIRHQDSPVGTAQRGTSADGGTKSSRQETSAVAVEASSVAGVRPKPTRSAADVSDKGRRGTMTPPGRYVRAHGSDDTVSSTSGSDRETSQRGSADSDQDSSQAYDTDLASGSELETGDESHDESLWTTRLARCPSPVQLDQPPAVYTADGTLLRPLAAPPTQNERWTYCRQKNIRDIPAVYSKEGISFKELVDLGLIGSFSRIANDYYKVNKPREARFRCRPSGPPWCYMHRGSKKTTVVLRLPEGESTWDLVLSSSSESSSSESESDNGTRVSPPPIRSKHGHPSSDEDEPLGSGRAVKRGDNGRREGAKFSNGPSRQRASKRSKDSDAFAYGREYDSYSGGPVLHAEEHRAVELSLMREECQRQEAELQKLRNKIRDSTTDSAHEMSFEELRHEVYKKRAAATARRTLPSKASTAMSATGPNEVSTVMSSTSHSLQPSTARPSGNVTQLNIEPFAGYNCKDVSNWFRRFSIAVRVVRADPLEVFPLYCDPDVYQYLELCVSGFPNADMVSGLKSAKDVWSDLQRIVLSTFSVSRDQAALEKELLERNQRIGESVGEFASTISLMAAKMQPPWSADRIKSTFFSLLNKRICARFSKLSGAETLQWMVEQARHWESQIICEDEERRAAEATGNLFAMSSNSYQAQLEEGELSNQTHLAAFNSRFNAGRGQNPNRMSLGRGAQRGRGVRGMSSGTTARSQPRDSLMRCHHCGIMGHKASECRKKLAGLPPAIKKEDRPAGAKLCSIASKQSALIAGFVRNVDRSYVYSQMLVDSGADANFVTSKFVSSIGLKVSPNDAIDYVDGSNSKCRSLGTIVLSLRLHHKVFFKAVFQVITTCPFDVILGPALGIPHAVFDFHSRALLLPGNVSLPTANAYPEELVDLPLGHPKLVAFFSGEDEDTDPDFMEHSHVTGLLDIPSTDEIKARVLPGGTKPKCAPTICPDLPPEAFAKFQALIDEFTERGLWDQPLSSDEERSRRPMFQIHLKPDSVPVWSAKGRTKIHHEEIIEENVATLLSQDLIERSNSQWSCYAFVVMSKSKPRVVFDLKPVNAATVIPKFEGTDLHDILEKLGACGLLSQGDLSKAYHQFPVDPEHRHLTAFSVSSGHYQWKVMPFGIAGAPAFFNKQMSIALNGVENTWSFFDDISTGTKSVPGQNEYDVHLAALRQQFTALSNYGLKLEPAKCFYGFRKIQVLGFEVRAGEGTTLQDHKVSSIKSMLPPVDKTGLRSFLGAIQVYSGFIPMLAERTQPLTELLKGTAKGKLPEWTEVHQGSFQWAKDQLIDRPMLRYPDPQRRFKVYTDASTTAVGGVLQQEDDQGNLRPIMFTSRKLTPAESRYTTQEIECLGMMRCLMAFTNYLLGAEFDMYTDHQALLNIKVSKSPSARIQRWSMYIQHYDFVVHHKPGRLHVVADWLSRADIPNAPTRFTSLLALKRLPDPNTVSRLDWLDAQSRDVFCQVVCRSIQDGTITNKQFVVDSDGLLYHREFHTEALQIVVPVVLQDLILKMCHSEPTAGHAGVKRTSKRLSQSFFWVDWKYAVIHHVQACEQCQQLLIPKRRDEFVKATPRPVVAFRFNELVSMDIQGPFVPTTLGNVYVLNMTDICTHFSVSLPMATTTALCVVTTFANSWVQFFGAPQKVCTDNGSNFTSALFEEFMSLLSTRTVKTTPYHPQANPVERFGRTLNAAIAKFVAFNQMDWDQYLGLVNYAYNTSVHSVTGEVPATAVFQIPPTTLLEFLHLLPIDLELRTKWAIQGRKVMESALEQCRNVAFKRVKDSSKKIDPRKEAEEPFGPGDIVWLADRQGLRDGRKSKHTLRHSGPYRVVTTNGPFSYWVQHVVTGARYRVHFHHLTMAPEVTQLKYRPGGLKEGGGGSEAVESVLPAVQSAYPQPLSLPTTITEVALTSSEANSESGTPITDPFVNGPTTMSNVVSDDAESGEITQHTNTSITKTTRSGRVVTVPVRYLNMFILFHAPDSICHVVGERGGLGCSVPDRKPSACK